MSDRGGAKVEVIRKKDDLFLLLLVPHDDTPQQVGILLPGSCAG